MTPKEYKEMMDYLKFGESNKTNTGKMSNDLQLGMKRYVKGQLKRHGDWQIHPVFQQLQNQSPMKTNSGHKKKDMLGKEKGSNETLEWQIPEYQNEDLTKILFYRDHISQSLPAIMRGDCNDWDLKRELDEVIANDTQDLFLISKFNA